MTHPITVCYFGFYDPKYARNQILIAGLRKNNVTVVECNSRASGIKKYFHLAAGYAKVRKACDAIVVGFPGYQAILLARIISRKPIIFDSFSPLYDSAVHDRKTVKRFSPKAAYYWFLDWISMRLADIVLYDTNVHIRYAAGTFKIPTAKFRRIFIGAMDDIFFPATDSTGYPDQPFTVLFFGSYIPVQGTLYIVRAADLLKDYGIRFVMIGGGQEKKKAVELARTLKTDNVVFKDWMTQAEIREEILRSDVCLGLFGDTDKTQRAIPNKIYECVAMRKPAATADTPAVRELFDEFDLTLPRTADPQSLAEGILKVKNEPERAKEMAERAYRKFVVRATPQVLGGELKEIVESLI